MSRVAEFQAAFEAVRQRAQAERFRPGVRAALKQEVCKLKQAHAMLVAVQFAAANHDCQFSASDALAVVVETVETSLTALDELEVRHARRPG